ncbi:hypothetical protein LPJ75_004459, partial [Coemansia sp. RSA 2598]
MVLVHCMRKTMACLCFVLLLQLALLGTPAQPLTGVALKSGSEETGLVPFERRSPVVVDVNVNIPALLITMPFSVSSGPSSVSGTIAIYFQASRSVKAVGDVGQRFLARISETTFLFVFEYQGSSNLPGHSRLSVSKDVLYLHRVEAQIQAE